MTRKRILFIDGDEKLVHDMAAVVEGHGFQTLVTASSDEGFELARQQRPDLVVVNVELAPTNGWSVCTRLKKDDDLNAIPVLLTSSGSTADTFEKHSRLKTRADEYLLKPYGGDELLRVVESLVGFAEHGNDPLGGDDEAISFAELDALGDEEIAVADDEPLDDELSLPPPMPVDELAEEDFISTFETDPPEDPLAAAVDDSFPNDPFSDANGELFADDPLMTIEEDDAFPNVPLEGTEGLAFEGDPLGDEAFASDLELPVDGADLFADEPLSAELDADDPLGGGDMELEAESELSMDDLAAFDEQFDSLTPAPEQAPAALPELGELDAFDASFASEKSFGAAEQSPFAQDDESFLGAASFDEAPLDVLEDGPAANESPFADDGDPLADVDFGVGDFDTETFQSETLETDTFQSEALETETYQPETFETDTVENAPEPAGEHEDHHAATLEARVAELEAELEGYRQVDASRDEEVERLREQLSDRDRRIHELTEAESRLSAELSRAQTEKTRREASLKALTVRVEQSGAIVRRLERELNVAREQAANAAELEQWKQACDERDAELAATRSEIQTLHESLEAAHAQSQALSASLAAAEAKVARSQETLRNLAADLAG